MSHKTRVIATIIVIYLTACGAAGDWSNTTNIEEVLSHAGVLVAPSWGDRLLASTRPVYTYPGEIPRLELAGDEGERLPLKRTQVEARLTGFVAEVEVRQTYQNPHAVPIEAVYIFPLPENSAVNHMHMAIGERVVEAEIRRRQEARREYESARREGHTAALLEQERPNVFTQSVTNIAPGESIDVVIRYVQDLTYDAGQYEFVFPMVVGPRFIPGQELVGARSGSGFQSDTDEVPDASRITPPYVGQGHRTGHDIDLTVVADATLVVGDIEVPTHEVLVQRQTDDGTVHLSLPERESIPNRDFVLRYRVANQQPRATLFISNETSGGYFTLAVHPPNLDIDELVGQREFIFVVDVSGSMNGVPLSLCRAAIRNALRRLRPVDTFNIITFAGGTSAAFEQPRPANNSNLKQAFQVVNGMSAGGGTYMANAIDAALSPEVEPGRHRYVFFLTDGFVGNEDAILSGARSFVEVLEARQQRARVFGFGAGSSVNRSLLEGLSRAGRGVAVYATSREDPGRAVNQFFRYLDHAVFQDVSIEWGNLGEQNVMPSIPPDLFASHAMILHGQYQRPPTGPLAVLGRAGDVQVRIPVTVRPIAVQSFPNDVLGTLWARSRVADLMERWREGENVDEEITTLGLEHRLVTQFTSFVAVDPSRRVGHGEPHQIVQPADNDADSILDVDDACPYAPEVYNGVGDDDGCPDSGHVEIAESSIVVLDRVYFEMDSAELRDVSLPLLDAVAATMRGNPQITLVEIQGHSDELGSDEYNTGLTTDRAMAVLNYLVEHGGVERSRLRAVGYGERCPIDAAHNAAAWEQNRRVEFKIIRTTAGPTGIGIACPAAEDLIPQD